MTPPVTPDFDPTDEAIDENLSKGFHLLQAKRRRGVVWCMAYLDEDETITVRNLAKEIAALEQDVPVRAVSNDNYRTVYTNLVQHHLPDLDEGAAIDYNQDRQVVAPGPNIDALVVVLAMSIPVIHLLLTRDFEESETSSGA